MTFVYTIPQFAISLKNYLSPYITCQRISLGNPFTQFTLISLTNLPKWWIEWYLIIQSPDMEVSSITNADDTEIMMIINNQFVTHTQITGKNVAVSRAGWSKYPNEKKKTL